MMIGFPGAGKSTRAKELQRIGYRVHSSDAIRAEKLSDKNDQTQNNYVFKLMQKRTLDDLRDGKDVIYDATNLSRKTRTHMLQMVTGLASKITALVVLRPIKEITEYNIDRGFPKDKLKAYIRSFNPPSKAEGFTDIEYYVNTIGKYSWDNSLQTIVDFFTEAVEDGYIRMKNHPWYHTVKDFNQNNDYHTKTLDQHIYEVSIRAREFNNKEVLVAALLHDIGKPYTQVPNKHGTSSYYGHEHVSAYMVAILFGFLNIRDDFKRLHIDTNKVITLIDFHMRMPNTRTSKAKNKLIKQIGRDMYPHLCELFVCDISGK
jgi:putative nucleotidyltransferase with HDIG domain